MANEAVIINLGPNGGNPVTRTVADGVSIEKGSLLMLVDQNTVSGANTTKGVTFGGIAAEEKVSGDGSKTISCYTEGVFDLTTCADAGITVGQQVVISGANTVTVGTLLGILSGANIGIAEETSTASEVIRVRLRGY